MKIGLITYNYYHLKTEQIATALSLDESNELTIFGLPFIERPVREVFFPHRPDQTKSLQIKDLAKSLGVEFIPCASDEDITGGLDYYLVLAGKIMSPQCISGKKVVNCHAGVIPAVRGLDAFKWAIYDNIPLGNTLHFIDEHIDCGQTISVVRTPISESDSLATLSARHYAIEIQMYVDFQRFLNDPVFHFPELEEREAKKRMPIETEVKMVDSFQEYLRTHRTQ